MKTRKFDLRVSRTRSSIKDAFITLLEEKSFNSITINDITTKANINRSTFYSHYMDKYDLMDKYQEEIMSELSTIISKNLIHIKKHEKENLEIISYKTAISIFEYLSENSRFIKAILNLSGDITFHLKMKEFIYKNIFKSSKKPLLSENDMLVPAEYLTSYITSAHMGVIQQWLNSDKKESPQYMANILSTIMINGCYYAAGLNISRQVNYSPLS